MNYKEKFISDFSDHNAVEELAKNRRLKERENEKKEFIQLLADYESSVSSLFDDVKEWLDGTGISLKITEIKFQSTVGPCNVKRAELNSGRKVISITPLVIDNNECKGVLEVKIPHLLSDEKYSLNLCGVTPNKKGVWKLVTNHIAQADDSVDFSEEQFFELCRKAFMNTQ